MRTRSRAAWQFYDDYFDRSDDFNDRGSEHDHHRVADNNNDCVDHNNTDYNNNDGAARFASLGCYPDFDRYRPFLCGRCWWCDEMLGAQHRRAVG